MYTDVWVGFPCVSLCSTCVCVHMHMCACAFVCNCKVDRESLPQSLSTIFIDQFLSLTPEHI